MSNFLFLQNTWPQIYREAAEAEALTFSSPKACAMICRSALEKAVRWLYANDPDLVEPYDTRLAALMHEQCFQKILKPSMFREINLVRKLGNNAAHGESIKQEEALVAIKNLFRFLGFLALYYAEEEPHIPTFDESLLPTHREHEIKEAQLQRLREKLEAKNQQAINERKTLERKAKEIEELQKQLTEKQQAVKQRKVTREQTHDVDHEIPLLVSEKQTRKLYIDQSLKEAGWSMLRDEYELEYEVAGMPSSTNPSGKGYVDYVLWGDDGKPLAVIEAKRTIEDVRKGKHQATLYADCLEKRFGRRPLIYYTNGFDIYFWDDSFYPERELQGFHKKDELQLMIDRRQERKDIRSFKINNRIVERKYQIEAIQRVAEAFARNNADGKLTGGARKALLVMATGTGKTRTSIAIVDMLTKCNWAKRVLFLADRNALVTQAKNAFAEFLPDLSSIDLTKEKEDSGTRLVFSTYPTMINKIDQLKSEKNRFYGAGHFDLVIIDEAHRSVYQKYGAIFQYFDSLLIGLTATPRKEIDRNTYELFDIEDDNPTFAYELDQAVKDKFLVPPKAMSVPVKFLREGIKYSELSEREKQEYEEKFGDPTIGEAPEEIESDALNKWLFNNNTVDQVLNYLMNYGIKVQGGDKLGKSIIFAKNHNHAIFIEERFNKLFPEYQGKFLRVIDNYESKAQDLLERFTDAFEEKDPQIAVSVDMLDTGIDAPRVVNLVFFKLVKSYVKFWQMVGRGTRLCLNLFGPNDHKTHFIIFDFCQNIEFFEANPEGVDGKQVKSLTQRIYEMKLDVIMGIRENENATSSDQELAEDYTTQLHKLVKRFDYNRFQVKMNLRHVLEYSVAERWENLSKGDVIDIKKHLAPLELPDDNEHELARRFDVLILSMQLAMLEGRGCSHFASKVSATAKALETKKNIPAVNAQLSTIKEVQSESFWKTANIKRLEEVRRSLRDLVKFLDAQAQEKVFTSFEDTIDVSVVDEKPLIKISTELRSYRDRVESYIRKNKHHITIQKLRSNAPITAAELQALETMLFDGEERGSKSDYVKEYGDQPLGVFIRSIVGLDIKAANEAFSDFLKVGNLRADQMTFINNIIMFLEKNGIIEPSMLFEPPFTDINDQGLLGVFDDANAIKVISIIESINEKASVA